MMCATEGSRIVAAIPASASAQAAESWGVAADQSIVVTLDLTKVYLAAADGASQYNDRRGMPSVVLAPNGRPGIIIPDAARRRISTTETLKKGRGEITAQDTARVQYTAWTGERKVTSSTWETGIAAVTTGADIPFAPSCSARRWVAAARRGSRGIRRFVGDGIRHRHPRHRSGDSCARRGHGVRAQTWAHRRRLGWAVPTESPSRTAPEERLVNLVVALMATERGSRRRRSSPLSQGTASRAPARRRMRWRRCSSATSRPSASASRWRRSATTPTPTIS
jgi:hypothetical protein